ncbi:MAG: GNAT family N-acetyltransferase [Clostridia bacterium]|nr:GNAT family N-acetyltransferase [Clostridia bacterium]
MDFIVKPREQPSWSRAAARWFHEKWGIPEEAYRCRGIARRLLNAACEDMRALGVDTLCLLTDHDGFYERCGWKFFCLAQGHGEEQMSRMYIQSTAK